MKKFKALLVTVLSVGISILLYMPFGKIPALAPFLSPFHGFWQNAESKDAYLNEEKKINGLKEPVNVIFDDRLVPHVYANNMQDAYRAQGYITASMRLWQMDIQTRLAAGRLAEILGPERIPLDRFFRRNGLTYGAENLLSELDKKPEIKALLQAYTDGVNERIKQLRPRDYPFEFKLLGYKPEEWSILKTALLLKFMAFDLTTVEYDIEHSNALKLFGYDLCEWIYKDYWPEQDPIIPKGTPFSKSWEPSTMPDSSIVPLSHKTAGIRPDKWNGSNNWAIHGNKTLSGKPLLANDPHLRMSLPSIWMEIHIHTPQSNVYGVSLPGSPAIIIGFNDSIAWGVTNAGRDVRDWFKITFKNDSKMEYLLDGKYVQTKQRIEVIKVKGQKDLIDTVWYTHHGPVVYDNNYTDDKGGENLALKWLAHDASDEFSTFYKLNLAKNIHDYFDALKTYTCPAQNFVFASHEGDVAIQQQGKFPIHKSGQGKYVQEGNNSANEWKSYIPFEDNPHIVNPARGFVSSANQHPTDTTYPYPYNGDFEYYRNRVINNFLTKHEKMTVKEMMQLQADNFSQYAADLLPALLPVIESASLTNHEKSVLLELKKWNYKNDADLIAPTYFETWFDTLERMLWDEITIKGGMFRFPENTTTVHFFTDNNVPDVYNDMKSTQKKETKNDIIIASFKDMCSQCKQAKAWTDYKSTSVMHLLRLDALSVKNIHCGGYRNIVNATSETHGPSWRMIVDLAPGAKDFGIIPGGQSGNPGSPFYANGIEKWSKGEYFELKHPNNADELKSNALFTQKLLP